MVTCIHCLRTIQGPTAIPTVCTRCAAIHEQLWVGVVGRGSRYLTTDVSLLRSKYPGLCPLYDEILGWKPTNPKGLAIVGDTGLGKTRVTWAMLRGLFDRGYKIYGISALMLADRIGKAFGNGDGLAFLDSVMDCEVLFIDDLDKMVTTERVQAEVFGVFERLTESQRIIITSNSSANSFRQKFSEGIRDALARRIGEFCKPIQMN